MEVVAVWNVGQYLRPHSCNTGIMQLSRVSEAEGEKTHNGRSFLRVPE